MHFQWFPGHMTKAIRSMKEDIRLIDLVIELADARIPISSRNPEIDTLAQGKTRILLLNKSDMADDAATNAWVKKFESDGIYALAINAKKKNELNAVTALINKACQEKRERDLKRGIKNRPVRAMIVGIPNVGKSTFINSYVGRASTKTGNRPGVTKGKQWIRMNGGKNGSSVELLDTPGILWPKFEDQIVGLHLAWIGSIRDERIVSSDLALDLIEYLEENYPAVIREHYGFTPEGDSVHILEQLADARGCLAKGGEKDYDKAAFFLLDDFRNARLGTITIEQAGI
ncbi:MAG: ribosome biogenesis GTPase YlqF [Eubacterium sp.]|nr:ribosome biogenesis GTPase YlqF [Eubacterium sp.]